MGKKMAHRLSRQKSRHVGGKRQAEVRPATPAAAVSKENERRKVEAATADTSPRRTSNKRTPEVSASRINVKKRKKQTLSEGSIRRNNATEEGEVASAFSSALQDILGTSLGSVEAPEIPISSSLSSANVSSSSSTSSKKSAAASRSSTGGRTAKTHAAVLKDRPGIFASLAQTQRASAAEKIAVLERRKKKEASHVKSLAADVEQERELRTLATKGMVRFLNAVMKFRRQQAKGKRDSKKEKQRRFQMRKKKRAFRKMS